jgi:hypothetical protein
MIDPIGTIAISLLIAGTVILMAICTIANLRKARINREQTNELRPQSPRR